MRLRLHEALQEGPEVRVLKEEESGEKRKPPRKMSSSSDRPKLAIGTEIRCKDGSYLVERLLGSGGFGDVYKVKRNGTAEFYALKTELNEFNGRKVDRLKACFYRLSLLSTAYHESMTVMTALASLRDPDKRKHFVQLIDKGKTRHFKLIVMQMVGPSIEDIRRRILCTDFTNRTAMYISQETLEGIRDLHTAGFIHRDIKPQNFAIGIGDKEKTIYVLDLGIAHRFVDKRTGGHKPARPKDDLEAWIYMSVELYSVSALPWRRVADKHKVLMEKDRFFLAPCAYTYKKAPEGYKSISKYIDNLTYEEEPNYSVIQVKLT
ncbi:unnamed protein product [Toxocara canis]|uniref:Protein kinase domain-containing protein n=1 Tax=Toxocara canis TaxID=6265 RepID=A0A183US34_TOXCA|nr:unnamed protein product [Toxocara canis]